MKATRFRDRFEHQFGVEMFNAFNHPQFAGPASSIGASNAGVISSLLFGTPMRQIQLAMNPVDPRPIPPPGVNQLRLYDQEFG